MVSFHSQYIENQVRERFERTAFREWTPPSGSQFLTQDDLLKIECISIGCSDKFWGIRSSAMHKFWQTEMSTYWCSFTWCSLDLDYNEMIKSDGWEDDLKLFSHIHTFYCAKQVPLELISSFKELANLGLSNMDIHDWSILTGFQNLYTISLNRCGSNGNQAIKCLCDLYMKQKENQKRLVPGNIHVYTNELLFMAVAGMCVNDLTPFMHVGESLQLCELNLSNNAIKDISPLSGACVDTLILNNNEIENIDLFDRSRIYWINLDDNRLKQEDIVKNSDANSTYL